MILDSQKGIAQLALVLLLLAGVGIGTYLVQTRTNLLPKALEGQNPGLYCDKNINAVRYSANNTIKENCNPNKVCISLQEGFAFCGDKEVTDVSCVRDHGGDADWYASGGVCVKASSGDECKKLYGADSEFIQGRCNFRGSRGYCPVFKNQKYGDVRNSVSNFRPGQYWNIRRWFGAVHYDLANCAYNKEPDCSYTCVSEKILEKRCKSISGSIATTDFNVAIGYKPGSIIKGSPNKGIQLVCVVAGTAEENGYVCKSESCFCQKAGTEEKVDCSGETSAVGPLELGSSIDSNSQDPTRGAPASPGGGNPGSTGGGPEAASPAQAEDPAECKSDDKKGCTYSTGPGECYRGICTGPDCGFNKNCTYQAAWDAKCTNTSYSVDGVSATPGEKVTCPDLSKGQSGVSPAGGGTPATPSNTTTTTITDPVTGQVVPAGAVGVFTAETVQRLRDQSSIALKQYADYSSALDKIKDKVKDNPELKKAFEKAQEQIKSGKDKVEACVKEAQ